jgi:hypothetical protein
MRTIRPLFLAAGFVALASQAADASLLVGFYDFEENTSNESADTSSFGFSGNVTKGGEISRTAGGSSSLDVSYGNSGAYSVPSVVGGDGFARVINSDLTFSFTNNSLTDSFSIEGLLFDATIASSTGSFSLAYKIGAGTYPPANTVTYGPGGIAVTSNTSSSTLVQNYSDFFRSLTNVTLLAGQTIFFQFTAGSTGVRIDNVGLVGELSPIPEPGSLFALGGLVGAGCFLRSRRRPLGGVPVA